MVMTCEGCIAWWGDRQQFLKNNCRNSCQPQCLQMCPALLRAAGRLRGGGDISACWREMNRCWLGRKGVPGSGNSGVFEGVMTTQGAPFSGSHKQSPENDAILKGLDLHLTIGSHLKDFK